ncbi:hypothetical protein IW262DRAFT_1338291 [Armillaria fumosa]|nr:hypothetical protein IW262DRAFT_1338291 [Armillaria fumosa]
MADDFADILGSDSLPVRREFSPSVWSAMSLLKYTGWVLGAAVTYVVLVLGWNSFSRARERSYRLSMRRRHGIPDNDHRPFNVAYAAVQRSRQDKERPVPAQRSQENVNMHTAHEARPAQAEQVVRNRGEGHSMPQPKHVSPSKFPGQYTSSTTEQLYPSLPASEAVPPTPPLPPASTPANRVVFADGYNTSALHIGVPNFPERPVRKTNGILKPANTRRKRGLEEEPIVVDNTKKSRVEGDELIDGDEEAGWQNSPSGLTRGNKRSFGDEDDNEEVTLSKRAREKRPRQVSRDHGAVASDEDMEVDEDEVVEVRTTPRGRKRDRVEAGPSFEREEDEEPAEVEPKSRGRKRRNKRRSDVGVKARGTKRERDIDDVEILDEAEESFAEVSRKKRGKRAQLVQEDEDEDDHIDISIDVSPDRMKGRKIGEEWESNGVRYKVGPNGQRLRQALVKKAGQRYIMPKDSQHPDREANIEVCVEKWLSEEEFREAKQQRLLAWQDSTPSKSSEPSTPSSEVPPSPSSGKHLLWDSTGSPKPNGPKDPFNKPSSQQSQSASRQSVATPVGLQPTFRRRIAGNFAPTSPSPTPPSPGLADSTNGSPRRAQKGYSKWEKQDLEAKAMMKMREANKKKREEKEALDRLEKDKKEKLKASLTPQPQIPVISVTKPAEESAAPKNTFNLGGAASGSPAKPAFSLASAAPLGSAPQPSLSSAPPLGSTPAPSLISAPSLGSTPAANSTPPGGASKPVATNNPFFKQAPASSTNKTAFSFPPATSSPLATNSPTKASEKPNAPGFGFPSAINPTPAPASVSTSATSSTPAQPAAKFSFSQNVSTPSAPTNSLLARMGPPQQQQQQPQQQSTPVPASQLAQKPQTFSFSTPPAAQSGTLSSPFFSKPAEPISTPAPAATPAPAPAKFNFSAPSPTKPNTTSSSLSGALGSAPLAGGSKPAEPSSNFGTFSFAKLPTTGSGSGVSIPAPSHSSGAPGSASHVSSSKPPEPSPNLGTFSFAKPPTTGNGTTPNPFGAATPGKFNFGTKESTPTLAPGFGAQTQPTPKESTPAPSTGPADNLVSSGSTDKSPFGAPKESAVPALTSTPAFGGFGAPGNSPFGASKESTLAPAAPSSTPAPPTFSFASPGKSTFGTPKESTPTSTKPAASPFGAFGQSTFDTPKESTPASTKPAASPFGGFGQSTTFGTPKESPVSSTPATSAFGGFGGADKSKAFGTFGSKPAFGAGPSSTFGKSGIFGAAVENEKEKTSGSDSSANGTSSTPSAPTIGSSAFSSPFGKQSGDSGTPSSAFGTSGAFGAAAAKGTEASGAESSSAQANGPTFASTSSPSPFGKPTQSGSSGAQPSAFGTSSAFGAAATKGTDASGPDSSSAQTTTATFGSTSSPSPFGKPTSDTPKPFFSFATPGTTTPAPPGGAFSFASKPTAFGGGSGSTTPSVLGAQATEKK